MVRLDKVKLKYIVSTRKLHKSKAQTWEKEEKRKVYGMQTLKEKLRVAPSNIELSKEDEFD